MKEENKIFEEWYELNFKELPNPLEYVYFRDLLDFQRYLLRYRYKELLESISKEWKQIRRKKIKNDKS